MPPPAGPSADSRFPEAAWGFPTIAWRSAPVRAASGCGWCGAGRCHRRRAVSPSTGTRPTLVGQLYGTDRGPAQPLPLTGQATGLDLGLATFATTCDAESDIPNPRLARAQAQALARSQRKSARTRQGSAHRARARRCRARIEAKTAAQRVDFHHKAARGLVGAYDRIGVENLAIRRCFPGGAPPRIARRVGRTPSPTWNSRIGCSLARTADLSWHGTATQPATCTRTIPGITGWAVPVRAMTARRPLVPAGTEAA
jgi:hypothetical protein